MLSTTEETIQQFMNSKLGKENAVERVKKIKDYAFVHFKDRDDALQAMELTNSKSSGLNYKIQKKEFKHPK